MHTASIFPPRAAQAFISSGVGAGMFGGGAFDVVPARYGASGGGTYVGSASSSCLGGSLDVEVALGVGVADDGVDGGGDGEDGPHPMIAMTNDVDHRARTISAADDPSRS